MGNRHVIEKNTMYKRNLIDFFAIANIVSDGVYVIDKNGVIVDVNKCFADIIGIEESKLIGRKMQNVWDMEIYNKEEAFLVLDHKDKMPMMAILNQIDNKVLESKKPRAVGIIALEEKKETSIITRIERMNKTVIMTGSPFFDECGEISFVVTIIRDVTEFIKLKKKLETLENDKEIYLNELKYLRESQMQTDLVGKAVGVEKIRHTIKQVAKTDVTVLITGETGVGKEVVAREIYKNSIRKNGPYIKVNCSAIPEALLESELFGYVKGAFTGAERKDKLGLFQMADGGTILLDEIGEMPLKMQSKILRVLQEKEITRVGGTNSIKVDVRVIAATNQNLQQQIRKGVFREDLYYRLNVFPISLLPLRERREDISILAYHFLEKSNKKYCKRKSFEKTAMETLEYYDWPGNVRELQNIIERLVVIDDEIIIKKSNIINTLGKDTFFSDIIDNSNITLKDAVNSLEKDIIEKALKKYGSTYKAAVVLGIKQSTVVKKAKVLGISKWR
ncbi:sigma-54-dependent Fis family transcriptional regulator [Clostridium sp. CF012]|uniref:sigma-54 interaction domain-containing protein n=1 Tax=Clostridium sp. CF012 TaxID=2843319 RepID=UPI001C0D986D|nr:sigma 54-interacting transcriptional regulator [Clostridium sp. CF012]MBU3144422.1 sigma 54-interacting transcriptional regulator [Clostridium sp. CF012]